MKPVKTLIKHEYQAVGFFLNDDEYAIIISRVREIQPMCEIRKIPKSPPFVEGVINLRGRIVPIIDLRKRFDLPKLPNNHASKILIVEFDNHQIGLVVDNVTEVIRYYAEDVEKTPPVFTTNIDSQYIQGVAKIDERLIILLDIEKMLSCEEKSILEKINHK